MDFWIIWEKMPLKSPDPSFVDIYFVKEKAYKDRDWYAKREPDAEYEVKNYRS